MFFQQIFNFSYIGIFLKTNVELLGFKLLYRLCDDNIYRLERFRLVNPRQSKKI